MVCGEEGGLEEDWDVRLMRKMRKMGRMGGMRRMRRMRFLREVGEVGGGDEGGVHSWGRRQEGCHRVIYGMGWQGMETEVWEGRYV